MAFWNFPAAAGGNVNSINNAGLETFRDNALDSLTREICQNSLDAIKDNSKPVLVEFHKFTTDEFPKKEELMNALRKCEATWQGRNAKSEEFIEKALNILTHTKIDFLRISDFNTIGLKGAKEAELGSPWSSLIKEAGSSNKEDSSGGSFGIGKAAPILNSGLRTLFYSSFDEDGFKSHIGVANIMSFRKTNNDITLGNGYYTNNQESRAIGGLLQLDDSFEREETGTDIYVTAFKAVDDWKKEIIHSALKNFFITIHQRKLVVKVDGFEINDENLGELILQLEDNEDNRILKHYFNLLVANQTTRVKYPAKKYKYGIEFDEGEAELFLIDGEDLNRRVLMTRKTGMRLFEQKNISGSISFTGILMITGNKMNSIFKQMENPAHNGWSENRFEKDPALAKRIYADLRRFIREKVKTIYQESTSDVMDAVGLSDFLPNKNLISDTGTDRAESLNPKVKSVVFKEKESKSTKENWSHGEDQFTDEEQLLGEFGFSSGEQGGNGFGEGGSGGTTGGGLSDPDGQNELDPDKEGSMNTEETDRQKNKPISSKQKYICADKKAGKYKFMISPEKAITKGMMKFKVIGEQSDYALPIKNAQFNDQTTTIENISGNTIHFVTSKATETLNFSIQVDYSDYCVMEVGVYENQ